MYWSPYWRHFIKINILSLQWRHIVKMIEITLSDYRDTRHDDVTCSKKWRHHYLNSEIYFTLIFQDNESIDNSMSFSNGIPHDSFDFGHEPTPKNYDVTKTNRKISVIDWFTERFLTPPEIIDSWSKVLFPLTYILFNILYWMYYLVIVD